MNLYVQNLTPKVVIGHCDLISWVCDFALYPYTQLVYELVFSHTSLHEQTFDPAKEVIGNCDLIS